MLNGRLAGDWLGDGRDFDCAGDGEWNDQRSARVSERCGKEHRVELCGTADGDWAGAGPDLETAAGLGYGEDACGELNVGVGGGALGEEHVEDVVGGAVAEELAEGFFVPGDAVFFDEGEEVLRGEAGERGFGKVRVGGEEVFRAGVEVGEVASPAAGDEDFFAGAVGVLEDEGAASAAAGFEAAHETSGSGSEDENVDRFHLD